MGITTYLFHKEESLEKQRFNMFFLDMGENIHFHYRDLRIELSVGEFKELAEFFVLYSGDVLAEIEGGYRDGVLANTNEAGTLKTFWDKEKKLTHPVKYHERQLAIEETKDGYHLHIRNYKILLSKESFRNFVKAVSPIQQLLEGDNLVRDPLNLLEQNELQTRLISRVQTENSEKIIVEVERTFRKKAGQVLRAIGYSETEKEKNKYTYTKNDSTVVLVLPKTVLPEINPDTSDTEAPLQLATFLTRCGQGLDAQQLNQLKLKILSLLKLAEQGGIASFSLEQIFVHQKSLNPVVDLFGQNAGINMAEEIDKLAKLYAKHKLFFIKPEKEYLSAQRQAAVQDMFFDFVTQKLASHECVKKIYVLGSSTNNRLGKYSVPFVHFDWAKIYSDFDIYIELDPDADDNVPEEWQKKFYWERAGCDYYHFGDVGDGMSSDFGKQYPNIRFYDHLVEGYLFIPAKGDKHKRDKWFKEVKAQCIFSRDKVAQWLDANYTFTPQGTERFSVASFNRVYHVTAEPQDFVLKVYDSKHLSKKNQRKIAYEIGMLDSLKDADLDIALPVKNRLGNYITPKGDEKAVVFTFAPGKYVANPDCNQIKRAGRLLARFHNEAKRFKTKHARNYKNKDSLIYWLKIWQEYHDKNIGGTDININIFKYKRTLDDLKAYPTHCHGDLSLINYLFEEDRCWLIDFQSIAYGPALIDLTNGMIEFSARKNEFHMENLENFRKGYEEVRQLSRAENDAITDLLIIQAATRQSKLIRLHYGGFGYDLKEERLLGLRKGLQELLQS